MLVNGDARTFTVPAGHPALAGHFPDRPIVPGVLVLEAVLALAGDRVCGIGSAKFLSPLGPDERARVEFPDGRDGLDFRVVSDAGAEILRGRLRTEGP